MNLNNFFPMAEIRSKMKINFLNIEWGPMSSNHNIITQTKQGKIINWFDGLTFHLEYLVLQSN